MLIAAIKIKIQQESTQEKEAMARPKQFAMSESWERTYRRPSQSACHCLTLVLLLITYWTRSNQSVLSHARASCWHPRRVGARAVEEARGRPQGHEPIGKGVRNLEHWQGGQVGSLLSFELCKRHAKTTHLLYAIPCFTMPLCYIIRTLFRTGSWNTSNSWGRIIMAA